MPKDAPPPVFLGYPFLRWIQFHPHSPTLLKHCALRERFPQSYIPIESMYIYLHLSNKSTIHVGKYYGDVGNVPVPWILWDLYRTFNVRNWWSTQAQGFLFVGGEGIHPAKDSKTMANKSVNHCLERLLCPIFLGNWKPLKPATIALKIGHLAFQLGGKRGSGALLVSRIEKTCYGNNIHLKGLGGIKTPWDQRFTNTWLKTIQNRSSDW